ncbi:hypothetical protein VTJ49DRAFT_2952 [Mycothermus thermophilus]|uniref:ARS binding protein 2 n=1 Tax=Humicola insolens TaxID=85995 RepID=A0ABR3V997_HUMIN
MMTEALPLPLPRSDQKDAGPERRETVQGELKEYQLSGTWRHLRGSTPGQPPTALNNTKALSHSRDGHAAGLIHPRLVLSQQPSQPVLTASPTSVDPPAPQRRMLPGRNVDATSIEDAYVAFILYCNPGVPPDTDSTALRDAFRTPPKSGGKSFSTYTLFELIRKLESKELKTWAELALKLGVEPPDQEKGESSQKIQQYAVRLKRWMHSMHVDAFFEYLIGRPSPYWTEIPPEHIPVADLERDGVAAEDDMALRALLPQIKPRRGRRKPDDEDMGKSPSRRPSPQTDDHGPGGQRATAEPWTAQPDGRGSVFLFPPVPDPSRLNPSAPSWTNDMVQTPMSAYPVPQSAITPSTRAAFWADEPKSAITPSKAKTARRHGAKVVSSAWRSGGIGSSGKTRGRPPINRGANQDGPFSAFPTTSDGPAFRFPSPTPTPDKNTAATKNNSSGPPPSSNKPVDQPPPAVARPSAPLPPLSVPQPPSRHTQPQTHQLSPISESMPARPAKRSRLSLQVPERKGGEVRLATPPLPDPASAPPAPPPVVMVNGQTPDVRPQNQTATKPPQVPHQSPAASATAVPPLHRPPPPPPPSATSAAAVAPPSSSSSLEPTPTPPAQAVFPPDPTDRTHVDDLEALFVSTILAADWFDSTNHPIPACSVDEAFAFGQAVVETLMRTAPTKEAFLINLSGLAGGKILLQRGSLRITRLEELEDRTRYKAAWRLRYGSIVGEWAMEEVVLHEKWNKKKKPTNKMNDSGGKAAVDGERNHTPHAQESSALRGGTGTGTGTGTGGVSGGGDEHGGGGNQHRDGRGGGGTAPDNDESQADVWRRRYEQMAATLLLRDEQMARLQSKVLEAVKEST